MAFPSTPNKRPTLSLYDTSVGDIELDLAENPTVNEALAAVAAAVRESTAVTENSFGGVESVQSPPRGRVLTLTITDGGSGYTGATGVAPTGGFGSGLVVTTTDDSGEIDGVTITAGGSGYRAGDVLAVPGGTGGVLTVATVVEIG